MSTKELRHFKNILAKRYEFWLQLIIKFYWQIFGVFSYTFGAESLVQFFYDDMDSILTRFILEFLFIVCTDLMLFDSLVVVNVIEPKSVKETHYLNRWTHMSAVGG